MAQDDVVISPTGWVAEQARLYAESGGTKGATIRGVPCLLLDYRGRRTGQWRRTVLIYGTHGDDHLIVASNGGAAHHPKWYLNLLDEPEVELQVGPDRFRARAETLTREEKAEVWPGLVELFAPYATYQEKTSRDIPVLRLRRLTG
ncbi:nitroreductase family deazaflavin-dependent oxidoreductase [Streptomyces sp. LHD-70]|uniref:nitroreductase family deazaflavin-dependent oxidoreductase n=1 Tax=Streptomyces sp. LHD-70 TaxID=3072140 RepID=UPI00280DC4E5|nr:nitroreductase family deazaflavin-dependent oxidoreductase [Streptomyces sp. LHD-70]MDQ8705020.1 nitroreductase family deazaflavin-dependent oxidoreductase [Streptomyces sp. LHD-70]